MQRKLFTSDGIIIGIKNFSEADKIVTIFTPKLGKLKVLAKGAAKPSSRKRGSLDLFNKIKFSASHTNSFDIMTEVELISAPLIVKSDLKKSSVAYFFAETIVRLTQDHEANSDLYNLLDEYIEKLAISSHSKKLRQEFIKLVLVNIGFWPANRAMLNPDQVLSEVAERKMSSARVGKKLLE